MTSKTRSLIGKTLLAISLIPTLLSASAYQIYTQSADCIAYAHANMAAAATDTSTAFYNPAGMTRFCKPVATLGGVWLDLKTLFDGNLDFKIPPFPPVLPEGFAVHPFLIEAPSHTNPFGPFFHAIYPVPDAPFDLTFGFSACAPFGLETNYTHDITTGYAERTNLETYNLNPSVAARFGNLSIGVGFNAELLRTNVTAAIIALGIDTNVQGWSYSWNIGGLYEFTPSTRIGLTYRPKVHFDQTGHTRFADQNVRGRIKTSLPAFLTAGFYHDVNCDWSVMGTFGFTWWDCVKNVTVRSEFEETGTLIEFLAGLFGPAAAERFVEAINNVSVPFNFKNSWIIALGTNYKATDTFELKGGLYFDKTPTQHRYRELRIPDSDRYALGLGTRHYFGEHVMIDLSYMYIYTPKKHIDSIDFIFVPILPIVIPGFSPATMSGSTKASANLFAAQLTWVF